MVLRALLVRKTSDIRRGMLVGYSDIVSDRRLHRPVSKNTYRLHRLLKKREPKTMAD